MARVETDPAAAPAWPNRIVGHGEEAPAQLLANPKNWRIHPKAQQDALAGVMDQVGWVQEITVNRVTGFVVDGHLRVAMAISREEPMVPVRYVDLSEEEEALVLATLDPLAGMATTAKDALESLLADVQPGSDAVTALLEDVARLMAAEKARMLWTDPPYGVSYVGKTERELTIMNDEGAELHELLVAALAQAGAALEPGSPFYIARPAGALSVTFGRAILDIGWRFHQELQWVKDSMVLGHSDYHVRHETVIYGWTPGPGRSGRGRHKGSRWFGGHSETTVFEIPRPKASQEHPTAKPIALIDAHLRNSSRVGDAVLDPFLGSGTTMIAAKRLGRRCYGMEIEPRYVDVAVRRWEEFTGRKAKLLHKTEAVPA